ncbi:MAG: Asp-tRNA(Asn)/Glu-tRNA(Gln) amidotransferase subunit GatC [Christensenellaceae bacterium]|jgi:aspartyl-tRNA(Asn)/glutamyl-tRNA(Gln) amidotransferase subunit C|nr:Asp-tRNA(Asn)/Glu-tRNA(Gln) amidotransferase subunit GatC [Christensenellaceae bacterium]
MTQEEIIHLENLSNLSFTQKERENLRFESVLEFVSQIKNAKVTGECDTYSVTLADLRDDAVRPSLPRTEVLKNAPKSDGHFFVVPQVVE